MFRPLDIGRGLLAAAVAASVLLGASEALAAGGSVIGKVAGDLTERFNKVANPTIPPRTPELTYEYKPPEYTPGGGTSWSTGRVDATPPRESLTETFNRNSTGSLSDYFNNLVRRSQ